MEHTRPTKFEVTDLPPRETKLYVIEIFENFEEH